MCSALAGEGAALAFQSPEAAYPELFGIVGGQVPNFHDGSFLRGVGGNASGIGQTQGDAIRNIRGGIGEVLHTEYSTGAVSVENIVGLRSYSLGSYSSGILNFDASRIVPTASENRPYNRSVRYLIRALP